MALGGGSWTSQDKVLPGAYINFVSSASASVTLSERGVVTMPLELDWGVEGEVFEVSSADFLKYSLVLFGYAYSHDKLKGLRDLFLNASTLYTYRLNSGEKASNTFATAKYSGIRGNDLKVVIATNVDDASKFDVSVYLETTLMDMQSVTTSAELVDNEYVVWKKDVVLDLTAGLTLEGGTNGEVNGLSHQNYLDKVESYAFNVIGVATNDSTIAQLYATFTKRLRDEVGAKFQAVLYNCPADYEGVINVKNKCIDEDTTALNESALVYWVTGLEAGCEVNKSCLNRLYDGEYVVDCNLTQAQLTQAILDGEFTFHNVGSNVRVLSDINSLVTVSDTTGEIFKENQTIRVIDQIANDIATLFSTKYLGVVPNDEGGRISLWADIVKHHEQLQSIRAIESFSDSDVTVELGESKRSVVVSDAITVVNAMAQLYMSVEVS